MTTDYTHVAAYDVRNFIWSELQNSGLLKATDYIADGFNEPLIPIIPSQQVPEFNNLLPGKTYITYNVAQKNYGVQWWVSEENFVMEVVSRNTAQIQTIINFLIDLFRRYDLSAGDLNVSLVSGSPFKFLWFRLDTSDPVQPFIDEGGFMSGDLSVVYGYTREVDVSGNGRML
jgi:hypothetical protein